MIRVQRYRNKQTINLLLILPNLVKKLNMSRFLMKKDHDGP
ncbi:hypothetical protein Niako_3662 [Niastella koreensis GR20-10]|uniref:Uncharacterized protein n=1 Tax=Niastella koreensis (strain DSM 17620 / KACC 11465 / NBRC 106392 / GR20-10) TaxID=700598 RepID=G8TPW6_NIAKG|nr:hypothetical protein Niako_3662 [Niastella koreensis GR20-10]